MTFPLLLTRPFIVSRELECELTRLSEQLEKDRAAVQQQQTTVVEQLPCEDEWGHEVKFKKIIKNFSFLKPGLKEG